MNSSTISLKKFSKKTATSQSNIFKTRKSTESLIKALNSHRMKRNNKSNLKQLHTSSINDQYSKTPVKPIMTTRPTSSLLYSKKLLEEHYSSNTTSTSRRPIKSPILKKNNLEKTSSENIIKTSHKSTSIFGRAFIKTNKRFNHHQQKSERENKLLALKKQVIAKNKNSNTSLISQHSKTLCNSSDNFIERMKKNNEGLAMKEENIIKVKRKQACEEMLRKNRRQRGNHSSMDLSITERIKNFYDWDIKRKNKIEEMKEDSLQKELRTVLSRPQINSKSRKKNASNSKEKYTNNTNRVIKRLYIEDSIKRKEKQSILIKVFEPSFAPKTNASRNNHSKFSLDNSQEISMKYLSANTEAMLRDRLFHSINRTFIK